MARGEGRRSVTRAQLDVVADAAKDAARYMSAMPSLRWYARLSATRCCWHRYAGIETAPAAVHIRYAAAAEVRTLS
ncbi:hypothetical protein NPIL_188451 [Nephila pilipes]|uniref:Uncharacterized protein n=1 Tax=Nephila pilipes TaxID=299642 RepID=A0A8X6PNH5_NEPPI|nr:hypothetical protein NPIL_188451 [Nephila pilipes]